MTTFLAQADITLQERKTLPDAATTEAVYFRASLRTDRHQIVLTSLSAQTVDVEAALPAINANAYVPGQGDFPDPADIAAEEWVTGDGFGLAETTGVSITINGFFTAFRVRPNGGGPLTDAVVATYRPLPPTGG